MLKVRAHLNLLKFMEEGTEAYTVCLGLCAEVSHWEERVMRLTEELGGTGGRGNILNEEGPCLGSSPSKAWVLLSGGREHAPMT